MLRNHVSKSQADPGGAPPLTAADLCFLMPKPPLPVDKVHAPSKVNSLIRPCKLGKIYGSSVAERVIVADFYTCPLLSWIESR